MEQELLQSSEHIAMMQDIVSRVSFDEKENLSYNLPLAYIKEWTEGEIYTKGRIIKRFGIKYIVRVGQITASSHVYPETTNARTQYKPYQGLIGLYNWAYGERIVKGMRRQYEGVTYIAQMDTDSKEGTETTPDLLKGLWFPEKPEEEVI